MEKDEDFEIGVYDAELYYQGDFDGLLALRKAQFDKHPNDYFSMYRWAEVLIMTKRYDEALEILKPIHMEDPEDSDVTNAILDVLKGKGMNIDHFNWTKKPELIKLSLELVNQIVKDLKEKRKRKISLNDLYMNLLLKYEYLDFNEDQFFQYLKTFKSLEIEGENWVEGIVNRV